jgi:signal transduction histidine kinase
LEELVKSKDVLAVAITSDDGSSLLSAGKTELLDRSSPLAEGKFWEAGGLRSVDEFQLAPPPTRPHGGGGGPEGRPGRRNQPQQQLDTDPDFEHPFSAGGQFAAILVLDRRQADAQCRGAASLRIWVFSAGGLVLFCLALVWRATVRLAEARGHARLLESEARHLRELSQAAAGLAHETRNPLGLVRGWTQRLSQAGLDSPQQQQQAQVVVEECDRVTSRINQFLAFARPCEPKLAPVNVAEVVDELAALLEPDLEAKNLTLRRVARGPGVTIHADREMLRQALFNLVQNAVQSAPEGAAVETAVRCGPNGHRRIEVADRGPGVAADAVKSLFMPYFTTRSNGTGLGLAIVRRIATAHGWEAGYAPRPGGGSVFWLDQIQGS